MNYAESDYSLNKTAALQGRLFLWNLTMPFNGSGVFSPLITFVDNTPATAEDQNSQDGDIAQGLSDCMTRDGQAPATAPINMGGFPLQDLASAVNPGDAVSFGFLLTQLRNSAAVLGTVAGTSDVITATFAPAMANPLINGTQILLRFTAANTTTTPTLAADTNPAIAITQLGGQPLRVGSIPGAGFWGLLIYDATANQWNLLNPAPVEAPGVIKMQAMQAVPVGWMECNGASLTTTAFPQLFAAIGFTYGGSGANLIFPMREALSRAAGMTAPASIQVASLDRPKLMLLDRIRRV
ncbi:MAG: phage tail protein [Methylocella sp.]